MQIKCIIAEILDIRFPCCKSLIAENSNFVFLFNLAKFIKEFFDGFFLQPQLEIHLARHLFFLNKKFEESVHFLIRLIGLEVQKLIL